METMTIGDGLRAIAALADETAIALGMEFPDSLRVGVPMVSAGVVALFASRYGADVHTHVSEASGRLHTYTDIECGPVTLGLFHIAPVDVNA